MGIITNIITWLNVFRDKERQTLSDFTILVFIVIIFIISIFGFFVYCLWNNLITCNIMSISMLTISIVIYLYELLRFYSITKKGLPPPMMPASNAAATVEVNAKNATGVSDGFRNFIRTVNPEKICGVILFTVSYILSITASASSFSPVRDQDIKPFYIVKTIFIYILTIFSIIFINFAVGREITNKTIPHFLIKVLTYVLLMFIAFSCTDDNIFKISNILNLISSSIMLFIVIIILIYMFTINFQKANKNVSILLDILQLK